MARRPSQPENNGGSRAAGEPPAHPPRSLDTPVFAQPEPTADPTIFKIKHPSDGAAYKLIDQLNNEHRLQAMPFPMPRGGAPEPQLTLSEVFGGNNTAISTISRAGQIVFHATGDCGSTRGPTTQNEVTDKMIGDFTESAAMEIPQFCLLLGDIVYNFGEPEYYYDQFYEPYRNYHAPVLAAAGNHDGMISPLAHATSLAAYLRNFRSDPAGGYTVTPEAGGLSRTAQIQPGVFFTFDAPFVRILVFYSNTLEDPGVIANGTIGNAQLDFLTAALKRVKSEKYAGALLFAHHHPPCGNGGHNVQKLQAPGGVPLRTPQTIKAQGAADDPVTFENYDDVGYGYLRVIVDPKQLRIEYHPAGDGTQAKTPDDNVTIDLATRKQAVYTPNDLGYPAEAKAVRSLYATQSNRRRRASK